MLITGHQGRLVTPLTITSFSYPLTLRPLTLHHHNIYIVIAYCCSFVNVVTAFFTQEALTNIATTTVGNFTTFAKGTPHAFFPPPLPSPLHPPTHAPHIYYRCFHFTLSNLFSYLIDIITYPIHLPMTHILCLFQVRQKPVPIWSSRTLILRRRRRREVICHEEIN